MTTPGSRVVDLTHPFYEGMPHATTIPEPHFDEVRHFHEHGLRCMQVSLPTHCGTHMDAPSHFLESGSTLDELPVEVLIGPALCVEVEVPADEPISAAELMRVAADLAEGEALLIRTGWDNRFGADDYLHHPYLSVDAAEWLVERRARLVGVDTVTPELPGPLRPERYPCPVHTTLLGGGVYIIENLDLRAVGGLRCELFVGALRIAGGDGAPARVLARLT